MKSIWELQWSSSTSKERSLGVSRPTRSLSTARTHWRKRSRTSRGCFERSTRPKPVGTGCYTCFFWWHSFARLQDVSSSSASVQGRALKAEEYLMPVSQVWKNLKHRDGTIYLTYRTLKNFSWVFYWQRLNVLEWYRMSQQNCISLLSENGNGNARHQMSTNWALRLSYLYDTIWDNAFELKK